MMIAMVGFPSSKGAHALCQDHRSGDAILIGSAWPPQAPIGRWQSHESFLAADQQPAAFVDAPVMEVAEQHEIVERGLTAMAPVMQVMGLGPGGVTFTPRPDAATITKSERATGGC